MRRMVWLVEHDDRLRPEKTRTRFTSGHLGRAGSVRLTARNRRSGSAPGVAQTVGPAMRRGERIAVDGRINKRTRIYELQSRPATPSHRLLHATAPITIGDDQCSPTQRHPDSEAELPQRTR